ncbi:MAG: LysR family transcriptional regulator [Clostridia bacterium]|nr:LysR family transcriptional regulator [Deltaproteobacteria bacterium]
MRLSIPGAASICLLWLKIYSKEGILENVGTLRLFIRLCELGTFSAAARELRVKQSTASKWIAELERSLSTTLIERTTRSMRITDAGRRLYAKAVEIVAAVDAVAGEISQQQAEPSGRVRMSVPVVFGRLYVVPCIAEALAHHPALDVELVFSDRYVNLVDEGFDLAVRVGVPTDTSARGRKLADSQRCLVASSAYIRAQGKPRTPADLARHQCLQHSADGSRSMWRFRKGRAREVAVAVGGRVTSNNSEAVMHMARAGLGIALLADWLVKADLANGTLTRLLDSYAPPPAPVYALTPPGRYMPAAVRAMLEHLSASFRSTPP